MGWRSESRSSNDWSHQSTSWDTGRDEDSAMEGAELTFVCKGVPVLTMHKASVFYEHASWMLQSALSSSGKADALYEYCYDKDILRECRRLGLKEEETSLVRLRQKDLLHVKAVGTTGKRSVMLAVVVALGLEDSFDMADLWKELREYQLDKPFVALIRRGKEAAAGGEPGRAGVKVKEEEEEEEEDRGEKICAAMNDTGVELQLIGNKVPVLGLSKESIFQENASWLLQTATGTSGRAGAVYDYVSDPDIVRECRRLGLSDQEVGLARLKKGDVQHVLAVGTCGKRSIMLAIVVALVIQGEVEPRQLVKDVMAYDGQLESPVRALLRAILHLTGRPSSELDEDNSWGSWSNGSWSGGKRKWEKDYDGYDWSQRNYAWAPQSSATGPSKKRAATRSERLEGHNEQSLDKMLDDYWGDGYDR